VTASIALIGADLHFQALSQVRAWLAALTYPLQWVARSPTLLGRWVSQTATTREELQGENRALRRANLRLRARLQRTEALEAENMRLRDLLGSSFKLGDRVLAAELVAVDLDPYRHQVRIDKGSASGVFVGQPVLDARAVMGQVIRVSPLTATVLLITDPSHSLPVEVNRNGLRTLAEGSGLIDRLHLLYLPNNADIREGDLVVTSGLGGRFPAGYPVARVTRVQRQPGQPFARVEAAPTAHLDRTREVLLVWPLQRPTTTAETPAP